MDIGGLTDVRDVRVALNSWCRRKGRHHWKGTVIALFMDTLHARTEGNAFFVTEVLTTGEHAVPAIVRDAVLARVSRLSHGAAGVAAAAAILGTDVTIELLAAVSGRSIAAIDECVERGVLVARTDGVVAFRHKVVREAVEQSCPLCSPAATPACAA